MLMSIGSRVFGLLTNVLSSGVRMAASPRLLGRYTGGAGAAQEIQLGAGLSFVGDTLTYTSPGGGATWGAITGTLSSQADLVAALDAKAASSHTHATADLVTSNGTADAAAGEIGEYVEFEQINPVALTTETETAVGFITLTAGDWDVTGFIQFDSTEASFTQRSGSISRIVVGFEDSISNARPATVETSFETVTLPARRVKITTDTVVYLTAYAEFSAGTISTYGKISARRAR